MDCEPVRPHQLSYDPTYYGEPDWRKPADAQQQIDRAMDHIVGPSELVDAAIQRRTAMQNGIELPWSKLHGLFELRPGEVVLWAGRSGSFKSTLSTQVAVHAVRQGYKVGIFSGELPPSDVLEMVTEIAATTPQPAEQWMRDFAEVINQRLFIYNKVDCLQPMETIRMVIAMKMLYGCSLIVLDAFMLLGIDDELQSEKDMMATLAAVAKTYEICILLVAHARKPGGPKGEAAPPSRYEIMGSSNIVNLASSIVMVHPNRDKLHRQNDDLPVDDNEDGPCMQVSVQKQRNSKYEGTVGLYLKRKGRIFCNSKARMYKPWDLTEPIPDKTFDPPQPEQSPRLQLIAGNLFEQTEQNISQEENPL